MSIPSPRGIAILASSRYLGTMTSATNPAALPREEQYALVYQGICEVARRCNGAISEDFVGFNGQDTKFGKRIAAVPFEAWTDDVKQEAARIANTYQGQILTYTGIEIQKLPVVREAMGKDTNRAARDDARDFERRTFHVTVSDDGAALEFRFKYSPVLVDELKRHTMGARWNGGEKFWNVPVASQLPGFVTWVRDPGLKFRFSPEAVAVLDQIATTTVEQVRAVVESKPQGYMLSGEVVFSFNYNPTQKDAIKAAGARWNGADKTWRVRADSPKAPAVVAAARQVGLTVAKEVDVAVGAGQQAAEVKLDRGAVLVGASRCSRPNEVTPEFLALVQAAVAR
jgi:hypothetical protein